MIGKAAVTRVENARGAGQLRCGIKGPGPPDLPSEIHDALGATVNFAISCGDAHFPEQILGRQGEVGLHARVLQSREAIAARFKGAAESAGQRSADGAIAVEENPAAGSVPSFCISHF
jgi:hypothetical protein